MRKYESHFKSINGSIRFLPFVMSSFGGAWSGQASELVNFIARTHSSNIRHAAAVSARDGV
jgi:hypothetical protein